MATYPLSQRDRDTITAWRDADWSWRRLAKLTGVDATTLRQATLQRPLRPGTRERLEAWCADNRIPLPTLPRLRPARADEPSNEPAPRVIHPYQVGELARAGHSIAEIAARYHTSERRISDLLRRHHLARVQAIIGGGGR